MPPSNTYRRVARIVGLLGVLVLVVIVAALAFTQTAAFRDVLKRQAMAIANRELTAEVSVGSIDGNPFGTLVLHDVRLEHEGSTLSTVKRAEVSVDLLGLVTLSRIALTRVVADGLEFHLRQDEHGWNVTRLVPEEPEDDAGEGMPFFIDRCVVEHSAVVVTLSDRAYEMEEVSLVGNLAVGSEDTKVGIDSASFHLPERQVRVNELIGRLVFGDNGSIQMDGVRLGTEGTQLVASALLFGPTVESHRADVKVAKLSAGELERLIGSRLLARDVAGSFTLGGLASAAHVKAELSAGEAGHVAVEGTLDLTADEIGYDLAAVSEHLNVRGLLGEERPATDLTGTVKLVGHGTDPDRAAANFDIALSASRIAERELKEARAKGRFEGQEVRGDVALVLEGGSADARGVVHLVQEEFDVRVVAKDVDPAMLLGVERPRARLNGKIEARGRGFAPASARGEGRLELSRSTVDDVTVESLHAAVRLADERLTIDNLKLASNVATAEATGSLSLSALQKEADAGNVRYTIRVADLGAAARLGGIEGVRGQLEIAGTASGSAAVLNLDATLNGHAIERDGARIGTVTGKVTARRLGAPDARGTVSLQGENAVVAKRRFETLVLTAAGERRGEGTTHVTADVQIAEQERRHELGFAGDLSERENRFRIGKLRVDGMDESWTIEGEPILVQRGKRLTVDGFRLRSPAGSVGLQGEAALDGPLALEIVFDRAKLDELADLFEIDVSGTLSGHATLRGTADQPRLTLRANVDSPGLGEVRHESIEIEGTAVATHANVTMRVIQSAGHELLLDASLPIRFSLSPVRFEASGPMSGTLRAEKIDLAFLDPLIRPVKNLRGTFDADLRLAGPPSRPELYGTIAVSGGRAAIIPLGITYDPIELRARVESQDLIVDSLSVQGKDGGLTGQGSIRLTAEGVSGGLTLELSEFPILKTSMGEARTSGRLSIGGSTTSPVIEGDLETDRLVFHIPESSRAKADHPDPTITVIGPGAPKAPKKAKSENGKASTQPAPSIWERTAIEVLVRVPRNAWVRRSDTNIELRGGIKASKKPGEPLRLAGEINAVRGWYDFQGKKFNVEDGKVIFTGQSLEPLLDLTATHRAGAYLVRVKVAGTVSKPQLTLESEPPLEQADVLSVLLFGKPADELGTGESVDFRQQALGIVGGYAASELRESVANALGVDNLEFDTGDQGLENSRVAVGKYLTEDVFVTLSHKFGRESLQELRVEYFFLPRWSIETSADTLGNSGVDLFWRRRY